MVGRDIKGSYARVVLFIFSRGWVVHAKEIRVFHYILVSAPVSSFKRKMTFVEENVSVSPKIKNMIENNITIHNLMLEVEDLKRENELTEVKLVTLETNMVKEPMKCKPRYPEKFKKRMRVRIQAWLCVMENYVHAGNTLNPKPQTLNPKP
jgi:hypothetical protein